MPNQANILYSTWILEPLLKVEPHDNGPLFVEVHALLALGRQKSMISWWPRCCGNDVFFSCILVLPGMMASQKGGSECQLTMLKALFTSMTPGCGS